VYAIGGYDENYGLLAANYVYDPVTKVWTKLADMPTPRGDLMCVSLLGEVYALGGFYVSEIRRSDLLTLIFSNWLVSLVLAFGH